MKPFQQIKKDVKQLSQMIADCAQYLPESSLQVLTERRAKRICDRYLSKKREYPKFRSI